MEVITPEQEVGSKSAVRAFERHQKRSFSLRNEPIGNRLERLKKLENWMLEHQQDIRKALAQDLGKSATETDISEILPAMVELREAKKHLKSWAKPKKFPAHMTYLGASAYVQFEPKGVCLIISPWNYPFNLTLGPLISALAAGNTIFIKPSEFTPHTSRLIYELIQALFEEDLAVVFEGDASVATELLELPFDHIFFTGSPAIGKVVMAAAAKNLSSITLELGGKSPTIVDESANVKDAAKKIAWGKWLNAGQTCVAPDYLFVHESKYDSFVSELEHFSNQFYSESYTSIVNERHFKRLERMNQEALEDEKLIFGGAMDVGSLKFNPAVFKVAIDSTTSLLQDEIFGPILPIIIYKDLNQVISFINAKPKPLALYIFSNSTKNQRKILDETSSGTAVINDCLIQFSHPSIPFGGVNNSGIGKSHGYAGFLAFSNEKSVLKQRVGFTMAQSLYPPYTSFKNRTVQFLLKYF